MLELWHADVDPVRAARTTWFRLLSRASGTRSRSATTSVGVANVSHVFVEERRNDFLLMLSHHLVTLALIGLSYWFRPPPAAA